MSPPVRLPGDQDKKSPVKGRSSVRYPWSMIRPGKTEAGPDKAASKDGVAPPGCAPPRAPPGRPPAERWGGIHLAATRLPGLVSARRDEVSCACYGSLDIDLVGSSPVACSKMQTHGREQGRSSICHGLRTQCIISSSGSLESLAGGSSCSGLARGTAGAWSKRAIGSTQGSDASPCLLLGVRLGSSKRSCCDGGGPGSRLPLARGLTRYQRRSALLSLYPVPDSCSPWR